MPGFVAGWALQGTEGEEKKIFSCGPEIALIDFGLAWLQLPGEGGEVIQPLQNPLYEPAVCSVFNSQHDMRMFCVSAYASLCIDEATLTPRKGRLDDFAQCIQNLVETARSQSEDFKLSTSLSTLRHIRTHLRIARNKRKLDFAGWIETAVEKPFLDVGPELWKARYLPFIRGYRWIWKAVWVNDGMPALTHFQYGRAVRITDTPCFEPSAVLSTVADAWKTR